MTAIIRRPPDSMSSIASHVYPDHPQYHYNRPPLSQLPTPAPSIPHYSQPQEVTPGVRHQAEKTSLQIEPQAMGYGQHYVSKPYMETSIPDSSIQSLAPPQQRVLQQNHRNVAQNSYKSQNGRTRSPIEEVSPKHVEFKSEPELYQADSTDQIAPYLQIPPEINSSKGSLSDFAARITCLFWFESPQTLLRVEESESTPLTIHPLVPEANPTLGFRKWVTTMLSTTQVSTNVVLLALMFVYRLKKMNSSVKGRPGSEYRLLTVALMLGNKFLDDNTYTNKTWAEVSGITVNEIHVMEVEFLSNMKYNLYASKSEWQVWVQKLRRFAEYFDAASKLAEQYKIAEQFVETGHGVQTSAPITPTQYSHPTTPTRLYATPAKPAGTPTSRLPHPLAMPMYSHQAIPTSVSVLPESLPMTTSRKRSYDETADDRPYKRLSRHFGLNSRPDTMSPALSIGSAGSTYTDVTTPGARVGHSDGVVPRGLPLPIMTNQQMLPQLPSYHSMPQMHPSRAMASVYPTTTQPGIEMLKPQPQMQLHALRIPSMEPNQAMSAAASRNNSPMASVMTPTGEMLSPMVYGNYRSSPYKPVRTVNHLLAPPPSASLTNPANSIGSSDLQYRPLTKLPGPSRIGTVPHIPPQYRDNSWAHPQHQYWGP